MRPKLPYHMAYPMPVLYDDILVERRDWEYIKSMYPAMAKQILPYVEEECERWESPCSVLYDAYPDKLRFQKMADRIYNRLLQQESLQDCDWLKNLIGILLCQELYNRRCEHRKGKYVFY